MKKEELKSALGKISPNVELLESTKARMLEYERHRTIARRGLSRRRIMSAIAGCAAALIVTFGLVHMGTRNTNPAGSFDMTEDFSSSAVLPRMMSLEGEEIQTYARTSPEAIEEQNEFESYVLETELSYMTVSATVSDMTFYEAKDDEYGIFGFVLLTLDIHEIVDSHTASASYKAGDRVSAVIYLDNIDDAVLVPSVGGECCFCLMTGNSGDPTDETSIAIGLHNTWQIYSCYYISEN